jgi:hypothetical protein
VRRGAPKPVGRRRALVVALALLLVGGLFCAPSVAVQPEFGHQHGDHEPEHVHDVDLILRNPILTERVTCAFVDLRVCFSLPGPRGDQPASRVVERANLIRGPPAG